jgi:hypothetical protein
LSILPVKGRSPYGIYSFPWGGLDPVNGDPRGYLGKQLSKDYIAIINQSIDTANLKYHGPGLPSHFGFLNNTFSYRGFSISTSISFKFGYYFRKNSISYTKLYGRILVMSPGRMCLLLNIRWLMVKGIHFMPAHL